MAHAPNYSYWVDSVETPRFPALDHAIDVDVCVIGAGIVGVTAAVLLLRAGRSIALVEAARIAHGATGYTTAKISSTQGTIYRHLINEHGLDTARAYAGANERGLSQIRELVDTYQVDCDLETRANFVYAQSEDELAKVTDEVESARAAGLDVSLESVDGVPFEALGALRHEGQAQFHPVKYLTGLIAMLDSEGVSVFEASRVVDVTEGSPNEVRTEAGSVTCRDVVVATGYPILDRGFYFARVHPKRSYAIAGVVPRENLVDGMYISAGDPTRSLRTIDDGTRILLLVGGEGHAVGQDTATEAHFDNLESWARDRFAMQEITHRWSTQDGSTVDSIPYAGTLRRGSDHLFVATGFRKWGMTNGTTAASVIADRITGNENPFAALYDPHRLDVRASMPRFVKENLKVATHFVGDRILHPQQRKPEELAPGEAGVVGIGLDRTACYRDEAGLLHCVSGVCTHLGCIVTWNAAEKTWDCPCHGSRFGYDGSVIQGPAVRGLAPRDVD